MTSCVCRRAAPADAAGIHSLIAALEHHRANDLSVPPPESFTAGFAVETLKTVLADSRYGYLVAVAGSEIVGVLGIRDRTWINHFFVAASLQRQGIARRLWDLAWAKSLLDDAGILKVKSSLMAVAVYERLGFRVTGATAHEPGLEFVPMERNPSQ